MTDVNKKIKELGFARAYALARQEWQRWEDERKRREAALTAYRQSNQWRVLQALHQIALAKFEGDGERDLRLALEFKRDFKDNLQAQMMLREFTCLDGGGENTPLDGQTFGAGGTEHGEA